MFVLLYAILDILCVCVYVIKCTQKITTPGEAPITFYLHYYSLTAVNLSVVRNQQTLLSYYEVTFNRLFTHINNTQFQSPFRATVCKAVPPMLSDRCLFVLSQAVCLFVLSMTLVYCGQAARPHCVRRGPSSPSNKGHNPQFSAHVCCCQMAARINMSLGLGPGDFVLNGDPAPLPKKGQIPQILGPCVLWPNGWMHQDATQYGGRPRPTRQCVRRQGPSSPPLKGNSPQLSANVHCGQTAGWTKMPLGTEVGLSPGDFVFDGDPATPRKKAHQPQPNFWPMSIVAKRLDGSRYATWYGGKRRPRQSCVRWGRSSPKRGTAPIIRFMSIVARRLELVSQLVGV